MTVEQCEKRNIAVLKNAIEWANGRECLPLEQLDVALLGEYLVLNIPTAFYKFCSSSAPQQFSTSGAFKTIANFLKSMQERIIRGDLDSFVEDASELKPKSNKQKVFFDSYEDEIEENQISM